MVLISYQDLFFMVYIFLYIQISLLFHLKPTNSKTLMDYKYLAPLFPPLNRRPLLHFQPHLDWQELISTIILFIWSIGFLWQSLIVIDLFVNHPYLLRHLLQILFLHYHSHRLLNRKASFLIFLRQLFYLILKYFYFSQKVLPQFFQWVLHPLGLLPSHLHLHYH